jgi:hypothetical protein
VAAGGAEIGRSVRHFWFPREIRCSDKVTRTNGAPSNCDGVIKT